MMTDLIPRGFPDHAAEEADSLLKNRFFLAGRTIDFGPDLTGGNE
ncbi:MAG: hypothetical protein ACLFSE_11890 [Spirochaetia bacterium]